MKEIKLLSKIPWVHMVNAICMQGLLKWIMDDGDVWNERVGSSFSHELLRGDYLVNDILSYTLNKSNMSFCSYWERKIASHLYSPQEEN